HNPGNSFWQVTADGKTLLGCVQNVSDCHDKDLCMYVHLQFSHPVTHKYIGEQLKHVSLDDKTKTSFTYLQFDETLKHLDVTAATSFISFKQAALNWQREFPQDFETSFVKNRAQWTHFLDRIAVEDRDFDKVKSFYHHFYRALLFP
ncbi:alpha-mannosidase, partial [Streptococcus pyogenes]